MTSLRELDLQANSIGDEGAKFIGQALQVPAALLGRACFLFIFYLVVFCSAPAGQSFVSSSFQCFALLGFFLPSLGVHGSNPAYNCTQRKERPEEVERVERMSDRE